MASLLGIRFKFDIGLAIFAFFFFSLFSLKKKVLEREQEREKAIDLNVNSAKIFFPKIRVFFLASGRTMLMNIKMLRKFTKRDQSLHRYMKLFLVIVMITFNTDEEFLANKLLRSTILWVFMF